MRPLHERIAKWLVDNGVLAEESSRMLGLIPSRRYPERDPGPEARLRSRLKAVLVGGEEPSARTAQLISLLLAYDLVERVVERADHQGARRRAEILAQRGVVGSALERALFPNPRTVVAVAAAFSAGTAASGDGAQR